MEEIIKKTLQRRLFLFTQRTTISPFCFVVIFTCFYFIYFFTVFYNRALWGTLIRRWGRRRPFWTRWKSWGRAARREVEVNHPRTANEPDVPSSARPPHPPTQFNSKESFVFHFLKKNKQKIPICCQIISANNNGEREIGFYFVENYGVKKIVNTATAAIKIDAPISHYLG